MVRNSNKDMLGAFAISALFGLAVLNDFAITDPGMPLRWPVASEFAVALVAGLIVAGAARFINSRAGNLREGSTRSRSQLVLFSIAAGVIMGQLILAQMVVLAKVDPGSQQRYMRFIAEPLLHPLHRTFSAAVIEEVLFRYFGMTAIALVVARRFARPDLAFRMALITSAAVFGLGHLPAFSIVGLVIVLFNTLAGLLYGSMFWHWGLAYAILAHFAAGSVRGLVIHFVGSRLFAS